jgi:hypothetical protein
MFDGRIQSDERVASVNEAPPQLTARSHDAAVETAAPTNAPATAGAVPGPG